MNPIATQECAVVFPGQGCQKTGMAREFFLAFRESRDVFQLASDSIGVDMEKLCFDENELLNLTEYTQPAILTAEMAMYLPLCSQFGLNAAYFAGHSLGEYTSLVAAGVLPFREAIQIVKERGRRMQSAVAAGDGAMAAIILENIDKANLSETASACGVEIANFNARDQVVISGTRSRVSRACEELSRQYSEMRSVLLSVSAPFHSSLMKSIEDGFQDFLSGFAERLSLENVTRVLSNYSGNFHTGRNIVRSLARQISSPVRWMENMEVLKGRVTDVYEIGPQRVLGKFFSSISVNVKTITDLRSLERHLGRQGAHAS